MDIYRSVHLHNRNTVYSCSLPIYLKDTTLHVRM